MSALTIKRAITDTLEDLTQTAFLKFCHQLRDRREEPRVRRIAVEGKSVLEITDLLVSTFTEPKALQVTLGILRQINCNEEAETLNSKIKALDDVKKGDPTFRKTSNGRLETKPSQEALKYVADRWSLRSAQHGGPSVTAKKPEEVEAEAKACVLSAGGDPCDDRLVLSRFMIQFGQYKDQTFKWLLENDVSYTAYVVATHREEREHTMHQDPQMANKDSLTRYAIAYPEVLTEVRFERAYQKSLQSGQARNALVGFGTYRFETLQKLYKSKDPNKISYVNYLRGMERTCRPGSKMEVAVGYILKCDQHRKTLAKRKRVQSTRGRPKNQRARK